MNLAETAAIIPSILERVYGDEFEEWVPGMGEVFETYAWKAQTSELLTFVGLLPEPDQVRITVGLATDVQVGPDLALQLNEFNRELAFGRVYVEGNPATGRGTVVAQVIVPTDVLSLDHPPTLQYLLGVLAHLTDRGASFVPLLKLYFSGRRLEDVEFMVLMS